MKLLIKDSTRTRVIADSAVGRNGQPWFLPEQGTDWSWRQALAFRVSRLGKNVTPKFIGRYIDAVTLLWVVEADGFEALDYMDGAVVCGNWIGIDGTDLPTDLLASFTDFTTIKNGDILAMMLTIESQPIRRNDHISLTLKNQEILSFNIK